MLKVDASLNHIPARREHAIEGGHWPAAVCPAGVERSLADRAPALKSVRHCRTLGARWRLRSASLEECQTKLEQ